MKTKLKEWKEVEKELFTPEEIEASNFRVAIIGELIKARNEKRISQRLISKIEKCLFTPQFVFKSQ